MVGDTSEKFPSVRLDVCVGAAVDEACIESETEPPLVLEGPAKPLEEPEYAPEEACTVPGMDGETGKEIGTESVLVWDCTTELVRGVENGRVLEIMPDVADGLEVLGKVCELTKSTELVDGA